MMNCRKMTAWIVSVVTPILSLIVLWQAFRFCQGEIGAPIVDQINALMQSYAGNTDINENPVIYFIGRGYYFAVGIMVWCMFACMVFAFGSAMARIIEVGYKQYRMECKDA